MNANALNLFLFVGLPYVALIVCVVGVLYRYRQRGFTVTSLSSQMLERKSLFWGSVPFHIGIVVVFFGHLLTFLFPRATLAWNSAPVRLIILEVTAFTFGLTVLVGLGALMYRRFTNSDPRRHDPDGHRARDPPADTDRVRALDRAGISVGFLVVRG